MGALLSDTQREKRKRYEDDFKQRRILFAPGLGWLFLHLQIIPLGFILTWAKNSCKTPSKHSFIEDVYALCFLIPEIVIFVIILISWFGPSSSRFVVILITVFMVLRLVDIAQSWVNKLLVAGDPDPYPRRWLILTLINYAELILSFSVLQYLWGNIFDPVIDTLGKSAAFTVGTMTAIGSKYEPASPGAWAIYIAEIGFGLFFLIVIVARALTFFQPRGR